jgi:hypothetical protein
MENKCPPENEKVSEPLTLSQEEMIPPDYEIKSVPRIGLCGYWAVLLAVAAAEKQRVKKCSHSYH